MYSNEMGREIQMNRMQTEVERNEMWRWKVSMTEKRVVFDVWET